MLVLHARWSRLRGLAASFACVCLCANCGPYPIADRNWPDAYWRHGRYVLIAIDTEAQMALAFDSRRGLVTLVGPTVFSVGADDRFVVAKQHPCADDTHFDRSVTNYFVVTRATELGGDGRRTVAVRGPLTKAEFDRLAETLRLPRFSRTFRRLEWQRTDE